MLESPIALANAAIEARDFDKARDALEPLTDNRLTQRVCTLMARIEGETGNAGGVREWLARAVNAPRDPAWTADGIVADDWAAVSPVTGALDAFQWRVPVEVAEPRDKDLLAQKIEELVQVGAPPEAALAASSIEAAPAEAKTVAPEVPVANEGARPAPVEKPGEATDAEVVEVVKVVSTPAPAASKPATAATKADSEPVMKVVEVEPPKPTATTEAKSDGQQPAGQKNGTNGGAARSSAADAEVVLVKETSKKAAAASSTPAAEPKIFVSPRAPDDPGPVAASKKG